MKLWEKTSEDRNVWNKWFSTPWMFLYTQKYDVSDWRTTFHEGTKAILMP